MPNDLSIDAAREIEAAEDALSAYQREHYGPSWSHLNEDEANRLAQRLAALYERYNVAEEDRVAL